uniref:Post-GPI attachment to proteins 6 n=1 Tax=Salvator merianae TaxID=96440 RepID=A0A8D0DJ93_SALMN
MAGARIAALLAPLLLAPCASLARETQSSGKDEPAYVPEHFSQNGQKLSFYSWYENARLFRFRVPEDSVKLSWLLQMSKGSGPECDGTKATIYFRYGAPPVINPLSQQFPLNTSVRLSYNLTVSLGTALENTTHMNLSSPAAGDWFIAAHLPEATGKIEVKGFARSCAYIFQPDMFVLRVVDPVILQPNTSTRQTISWPANVLHAKVFVPAYSTTFSFDLVSCTVSPAAPCSVRITLGSATLLPSSQKVLNCTGPCRLLLSSPPWEKWLQITVESLSGARADVALEVTTSITACKPTDASSFPSVSKHLNQSQAASLSPGNASATWFARTGAYPTLSQGSRCFQFQPVVREDLDVVSVQFRVLGESTVLLQGETPALLYFNLNSGMDSGGTLVLSLALNKTSWTLENTTVWACLSTSAPVLPLNATSSCRTAFSEGYLLNLNISSAFVMLAIPYPESASWYLSLQLMCPKAPGECENAEGKVFVYAHLDPCFDNCGPYGYCSLLRRHGYVYAACICKAGRGGWSCTDDTKAQSVGRQMLATLLLTLSNLLFLPAIAVALYHYHLVEASVYTFTMFFSTFYHACDQPGVAVLCIMEYDTLQFCDFLGSVVSIWVTIVCMARLQEILKYILCILGTLFIAMSLQLDRWGIWNMLGPCLVALIILAAVWTHRGVTRRHCYPPSWKRWAFFLFPGICLAFVAILVYVLIQTKDNYYYTHSIWHMLVASSAAFLLPPGDKHKNPWAWSRKLLCHYQICRNLTPFPE